MKLIFRIAFLIAAALSGCEQECPAQMQTVIFGHMAGKLLVLVTNEYPAGNANAPIMVLPPKVRHAGTAVKPATVQMASAKASVMSVLYPLTTNYQTIGFLALPLALLPNSDTVDTNKIIWVQSTSALNDPSLPFTNVVGFVRNSASVVQEFSFTTPERFWRTSYAP